ncbi:hypothetical protein [Paracoccus pacificus]|uniref:GNAT family N-acetyltransferase n=1 Tax=Paracoccus pacificus TaxID=1463598 RepID=A0ABW4R6Z8_9RHOB
MSDAGPQLDHPRLEDAAAIAAALSDWETTKWLARVPFPYGRL